MARTQRLMRVLEEKRVIAIPTKKKKEIRDGKDTEIQLYRIRKK